MSVIDKRELELLREKFSDTELDGAIARVQSGEPLAYVIGEWYFYGLTFKLNRDCLIPRPDTEHVVDKAIELIPKGGSFIDLCTGSGCIAVSVKKHRPDTTAYALDISAGALEAAALNAKENGTEIELVQADVLAAKPNAELDCVISNPPYIKTDVLDSLEVSKSEPVLALDGGADGLVFYRQIIKTYAPALKKDGCFIFEIGYDQGADIRALAEQSGFGCEIYKDYGANDRVAVLKRKI